MKKLLLLAVTFCLAFQLSAQDDDLLVYQVDGKVKYKVPGQRTKTLADGDAIGPEGTLIVKRNAAVTLLYGIELMGVEEKGKHSVNEMVAEKNPEEMAMGFGGDFLKNLGKTMLDDPPPPPPPPPGRKGVGDDAKDAILLVPKSTVFNVNTDNAEMVEFVIKEDGTDRLVMSQNTKSDQVTIDLSSDKYQGKNFYWSDGSKDADGMVVRNKFAVAKQNDVDAIWEELKSIDEYNNSGDVQKKLWEAGAFADAQMIAEAHDIYKEALAADPDNELLKRVYARFVEVHMSDK